MFVRVALVRARVLWQLLAPIRSFLFRRKRIGAFVHRLLVRFPRLQEALVNLIGGDPERRYRTWARAYDTIDDADLSAMRAEQSLFAESPLLSLVVPVAERSEGMLEALVESLLAQVYERWELHLVGEPSLGERAAVSIRQALSRDRRFVRLPAEPSSSTAAVWNAALRSARGEFAVLADPCFVLRPHALFLIARTIQHHPDAALVYADDDLVDEKGARSGHYFKPDWNEALLWGQSYLGGLVAFRRSLALEVGGCREELDGDHAWGLFLRIAARAPARAIHHLPFILSHRRAGRPARPAGAGTKRETVARALEERLEDLGKRGTVDPVGASSYRARRPLPAEPPSSSVIVPSTGKLEFLHPCMEGILTRTSYPDLEVLVVANENANDLPEQREYLEAVAGAPQVRVLLYEDRPYNFSWVNNWAAGQARGDLLCFLNDDTEVIGGDWLAAMVALAVQDGVGAVGAMLFYPDDTIQHAGVVLGAGIIASHAYSGKPRGISGYHDRALVDQDVSCVTGACMLVRRDAFLGVGGFDEALGMVFNDVDLCLRLRKSGWRIVWTPSAELYHRESVSFGRHDAGETERQWELELSLIRSRWSEELSSDPHHNPNLSLDPLQLWEPAFPPRVRYPWRSG